MIRTILSLKCDVKMLRRPLFVVDMTLFEFLHIITLIKKVILNYSEEHRRNKLKEEIYYMFGKLPIDEGKPPRRNASSKKKMTGNYMITINQLNLLDDIDDFNDLYNSYKSNLKVFFLKLRKLLLIKGRWIEYIKAIKLVNSQGNFESNVGYQNEVANEMHRNFPKISSKAHFKQFSYVKRWMVDKNLQLIGDFNKENGLEIIESNIIYK